MTKPLPPSYLCPRCLLRSYHPRDVAERYCARCGEEDWFDREHGERLRDEGMDLVGQNNSEWLRKALEIIRRHAPRGRAFLAEEFRRYPGIGEPSNPNAWGALTNAAVREGIIEGTGRFQKAGWVRNHAHKYELYRRCAR